jgi:hypothetical protein
MINGESSSTSIKLNKQKSESSKKIQAESSSLE